MESAVEYQCEYGTAKAGNKHMDRCDEVAIEVYIHLSEPIHLCKEHYEEFHYFDLLSKR